MHFLDRRLIVCSRGRRSELDVCGVILRKTSERRLRREVLCKSVLRRIPPFAVYCLRKNMRVFDLLVRDDEMAGSPQEIQKCRYADDEYQRSFPSVHTRIPVHTTARNLPHSGLTDCICGCEIILSTFSSLLAKKSPSEGIRKHP